MIPAERREDAKKILAALALTLERQRLRSFRAELGRDAAMKIATPLLGVTAALATSLIGSKLFEGASNSPVTYMLTKLLPAMGIFLAGIVALQVIVTALRIRRRNVEAYAKITKPDIH